MISRSTSAVHHFGKECGAGPVSDHLMNQQETMTDQGTLFMSHTLKELYKLLGIKSV